MFEELCCNQLSTKMLVGDKDVGHLMLIYECLFNKGNKNIL